MYRGFRIVSVEWSPIDCYYNCRSVNDDGDNVLFITGDFVDAYRAFEQAVNDFFGVFGDYRDFLIESVEWDEENQFFFGKAYLTSDPNHFVTFIDTDFSSIYTTFTTMVDEYYEFLEELKETGA